VNETQLQEDEERLLEITLPPPHGKVEVPLAHDGQPCTLCAQVGPLEDRSAIRNTFFNRSCQVRLLAGTSSILISVFAVPPGATDLDEVHAQGAAVFIGEVCLPYDGEGGLSSLGLRRGGEQLCLRLAFVPGARCREAPPDMLAKAFQQARHHFQKGVPHIVVWIKELEPPQDSGSARTTNAGPSGRPPSRAEVLRLELETMVLERSRSSQPMRTGPEPDAEPDDISNDPRCSTPQKDMQTPRPTRSLLADMWRLQAENAQLAREQEHSIQKLESANGLHIPAPIHAKRPPLPTGPSRPQWGRTVQVLQAELQHCKERQERIDASFEEKISNLRQLHWQAQQKADAAESRLEAAVVTDGGSLPGSPLPRGTCPSPGSDCTGGSAPSISAATNALAARMNRARQRKQEAENRRNNLWEQLHQITSNKAKDSLCTDPTAQRLNEQGHQYKAELVRLQQELQGLHANERGDDQGHASLKAEVQQLFEDLDEYRSVREDEKVRSESELRELRAERDSAVERDGDARMELRRLQAQLSELRDLGGANGNSPNTGNAPGSAAAVASHQASQQEELGRLQSCEADKRQSILTLEQEQDQLVEQMSRISSQAVLLAPSDLEGVTSPTGYAATLESKAADLEMHVIKVEAWCEECRQEIADTTLQVQAVQAQSGSLRQVHAQQQKNHDERVQKFPSPTRSGSFRET